MKFDGHFYFEAVREYCGWQTDAKTNFQQTLNQNLYIEL